MGPNLERLKNMSKRIKRRPNQEMGESSSQNEQLNNPYATQAMPQLDPTQPRTTPDFSLPMSSITLSHPITGQGDILPALSSGNWSVSTGLGVGAARNHWLQKTAPESSFMAPQKNKQSTGTQQNPVDLTHGAFPAGQNLPGLSPASSQSSSFKKAAPLSPSSGSKLRSPSFLRRHGSELNTWSNETSHGSNLLNPQIGSFQDFSLDAHIPCVPTQPWNKELSSTVHSKLGTSSNGFPPSFGPPGTNLVEPSDYLPKGKAPTEHDKKRLEDIKHGSLTFPPKGPPSKIPKDLSAPGAFLEAKAKGLDFSLMEATSDAAHKVILDASSKKLRVPTGNDLAVDSSDSANVNKVSSDSNQAVEDLSDEDLEGLQRLREFVSGAANGSCTACRKKISLCASDVVKLTRAWCSSTGVVLIGLKCPNIICNKHCCAGCGKTIPADAAQKPRGALKVSGMDFKVYWCCEAGRLVGIWALACGWTAPSTMPAPVANVVEKVRNHGHNHGHNHVKFSFNAPLIPPSATAKGVGYGGEHFDMIARFPSRRPRNIPERIVPIDTKEDLVREAYFRLLALLLPIKDQADDLDALAPGILRPILLRSPLIEQAALMLGKDSITETARQYYLYDGILDLVELLGSHAITASLVYDKRNIYHERSGSLLGVSFATRKYKGGLAAKDTGKSLTVLLGSLASQAKGVLRYADANAVEFQNGDGQHLLGLSRRLALISEQHVSNRHLFRSEMEICSSSPEINLSQWHRENCVKEVSDETILEKFAFTRDAQVAANKMPLPGRMKRLITELSTLQTSLPEGIYVRHGSSRLDIMKVLIIGPKGTPYEHGFFEFDLFCQPDYPNTPPVMVFKSTGIGRKVRFNPNLYEDGKICLSLLGTWSGEPWRPNHSTILQILVSIQSMILCEEPWYNEPGREMTESKSMSIRYNDEIRLSTHDIALRPWLNALSSRVTHPATSAAKDASSLWKGLNTHGRTTDASAPKVATSLWDDTVQIYLQANAKEIAMSASEAARQSSNANLQSSAFSINYTFRAKGYLD